MLSIVGIAIGIATIVALGLITGGMQESVQTTLNNGGAEIIVSEANIGGMRSSGQLNETYVDELKNISGVSQTAGILSIVIQNEPTSSGGGGFGPMLGFTINGINKNNLNLVGITSVNGCIFSDNANEIILGKLATERQNKSLGDTITISNTEFKIVGIYETGSLMIDSGAYVSLSKLQNITKKDYINQILVKTTEGANDKEISDYIENQYPDELSTITAEERAEMIGNAIEILNIASLAISALAIVIGGIGIVNTMIMTVYERTKEIGVLKAIGWKSKRILGMILGETLVLTLVSGVIGIIFGIILSELGMIILSNDSNPLSLAYNLDTFLMAFGIAILVGLLGGIYPAYRASKLPPTEALRYE